MRYLRSVSDRPRTPYLLPPWRVAHRGSRPADLHLELQDRLLRGRHLFCRRRLLRPHDPRANGAGTSVQPIAPPRLRELPAGTTPHTTAPLDFLIAGLSLVLKPFSAQSLDLAGAFISPLLGACWSASCGGGRGRSFRQSALAAPFDGRPLPHPRPWVPARSPRPSISHPPPGRHRLVGRDRPLAQHPGPLASVSAISWGLALWVSLFEPAILLLSTLLLRALVGFPSRRRALLPDRTSLITLLRHPRRMAALRRLARHRPARCVQGPPSGDGRKVSANSSTPPSRKSSHGVDGCWPSFRPCSFSAASSSAL